MIDEVIDVKGVLKYEACEEFQLKGRTVFLYWFKLNVDGKERMIKVFSSVGPDDARKVVLSSFNNAISIEIK